MHRVPGRALRFLRVLIACALIALAARPATIATTWADGPALLAVAGGAVAASSVADPAGAIEALEAIEAPADDGVAPLAFARPDEPRPPAAADIDALVVPRRYQRNCSLLC
jgi:hypothetical protein